MDGAKKINVGPDSAQGEQYDIWWQAALLPQDVDDSHHLRASLRLSVAGAARRLWSLADGLFALAALVRKGGLEGGSAFPVATPNRGVALC